MVRISIVQNQNLLNLTLFHHVSAVLKYLDEFSHIARLGIVMEQESCHLPYFQFSTGMPPESDAFLHTAFESQRKVWGAYFRHGDANGNDRF